MRRFMAVVVLAFILLAVLGCAATPDGPRMSTSNLDVSVQKLFTFQGTTVYRLKPSGDNYGYFTLCNDVAQPERTEASPSSTYWTASYEVITIRIQNNSSQFIQVYDGAWLLSSLSPGESRNADLKLSGERRLKVRSAAWTVETQPERFERNCGWLLTVEFDGVHLDLNPTPCTFGG